jgi:ubiquinone/menaquinone biosynthesis C-methylase UbiE
MKTANPYRKLMERELKKLKLEGKKILEVGAGKHSYKHLFSDVISTDIDDCYDIDEIADVTNLHYEDCSFDCVLCINVLEHIKDYQKAISEIHRVLKPDGQAIIAVPFFFPIHDIPSDYWRFTEYGLKIILSEFKKVEIKPLGFHRLPFGYFVRCFR